MYSLVCGSGIPFVGCDCMAVDVVNSLFPHINDDARSKSHQICRYESSIKMVNNLSGLLGSGLY